MCSSDLPEPFPNESELMMNWDEARTLLKSGHIVGSHTMTHPNVAQVSVDDARSELAESKLKLEKELGEPVEHFAYPHPAAGRSARASPWPRSS